MYLEIEFEEQDQSFDLEFEQVTEISDGGYERGYAEGYEQGNTDGYTTGKTEGVTEGYQSGYAQGDADGQATGRAEGESIGYADALAKRTDLVVTENGEYTPSGESTGFKTVSVNVQAEGGNRLAMYMSNTLTEVKQDDFGGATSIANYAFRDKTALESVEIPSQVTSVGNYAFASCSALKQISLPNVTSLGSNVFYNCSLLESVSLGNGIKIIPTSAFENCKSLLSITFPNGVTEIASSAFRYCSKLESVSIPPSLTKIGYQAFYDCNALKGVYISDLTSFIKITGYNTVDSAGWSPVYYAKNLYLNGEPVTEVAIPNDFVSLTHPVLAYCTSIKKITFPSSLTSVCSRYCHKMTSLEEVVFDDGISITEIPAYMFASCESLKNITIPNSVTRLSIYSLAYMTNLEKVVLGENISYIDGEVFYDSAPRYGSFELYIKAPTPPTLTSVRTLNKVSKIAVPIGSGDAYKAATNWSTYADIIVEEAM